ncbi:sulfotransferase family protein [Actinomadura fibrosa]|uniref:Sulfotransferase family protein n=1 Tax=Actinomadura fibrosa TaxID=111802 RepID=A0ABW2XYI9_9ACTN|nr:sulfotransferase [Actinomadura fibrosa]
MSPDLASRPERPIFLFGCTGSGTALLRSMLHAHPRIAIPTETRFVLPAYTARCEFGDLNDRENRRALATWLTERPETRFSELGLDAAEVAAEIAAGPPTLGSALGIVFRAYARRFGKPRWGDRRPAYAQHVGTLLRMFPDAQFVHLVRDGRDCVATLQEMPWFEHDVHHAISVWRETIDTGRRLATRLGPDAYYELQYERLIADPADELIRLCGFLGEDYDPAMTWTGNTAPPVPPQRGSLARAPRDRGLRERRRAVDGSGPVPSDRVGAWAQRLEPWEIGLAEAAFGERLAEYGYEPSGLPGPSAAQLARFTRTSAHRRMAQRKADLRERWQRRYEPNPVVCLPAAKTSTPAPIR